MRVLLLHEMSGVHTELKDGLQCLGIDAQIATYGDGWKKYRSDIDLGSVSPALSSHIERLIKQTFGIKYFSDFDVIQLISPNPFYRPISRILEKLIFLREKKLVYVAAGSDAIYRNHVRELNYYPPHEWFEKNNETDRLKKMLSPFNAIVPVCWEYKYGMQRAGLNPKDVMPFPINIQKQRFQSLGRSGKIRFFHPLNRENLSFDFKGTLLIKQAFADLAEKYSDVAEFVCAGGMSHEKYDELTDDVDVIVDQAYSFSYGMSAAYGLAKGKIVLSGLEDLVKDCEFYKNCPIINIKPSVDDIKGKIERLLLNKNELPSLGEKSRYFAETHHDHVRVAEKFLKIYMEQ